MGFDELRQAVNSTHGSLHQAFLAWDKGGSGELTKARLRVGLRACRGAKERNVEDFMSVLFADDNMDKVTFNKLFQAFHEGERRYPGEVSKGPVYQSQTLTNIYSPNSRSEETELSSMLMGSAKVVSPQRPRRHSAGEVYLTPTKTSPQVRKAVTSPAIERKLNFDEDEEKPRLGFVSTRPLSTFSSSPIFGPLSPPGSVSSSSARFQRMREARLSPPFQPESRPFPLRPGSGGPMFDAVERKMFETRARPRETSSTPSRVDLQRVKNGFPAVSAKSPKLNGSAHRVTTWQSSPSFLEKSEPSSQSVVSNGSDEKDDIVFDAFGRTEVASLDATTKSELKATLLSMARDTPSSPVESMISPSDLRRSLHAVDPKLSRQDVKLLARALVGGYSPSRVRITKVLKALDEL